MLRDRNATYNFIGSAIIALSAIIAAPFYLRLLGNDAFGLLGFSYVVMGVISVFDMGLSPALQRQLAILASQKISDVEINSTVKTLGFFNLLIALVVGSASAVAFIFGAADGWLGANSLAPSSITHALAWISGQAAIQIMIMFYGAGLLGLQHQAAFNAIFAGYAMLRVAVSLLLLQFAGIGIEEFFVLQAVISAAHLCFAFVALQFFLPKKRGVLSFGIIKQQARFALGMFAIATLAMLLTQIDKLILSATMSLTSFGYYMLAWNIAMLVIKPAQPIYNAYLPVLSQLAGKPAQLAELTRTYHTACRKNAALIWPLALFLALLSFPILWLYTGSVDVAKEIYLVLAILTLGSALNATALMPYALTQAHGWVNFSIVQNIVACAVMIPICFFAGMLQNLEVAALGWLIINLGYATVSQRWLHTRLLPGELAHWYLKDHRLEHVVPKRWFSKYLAPKSHL